MNLYRRNALRPRLTVVMSTWQKWPGSLKQCRILSTKMLAKIKQLLLSANMRALYNRLGGRSFLVVTFFAVTGFFLAWHAKLTSDYAALATALSGFHIWRARSEDQHGSGKDKDNSQ
jgi:hypothetical protein